MMMSRRNLSIAREDPIEYLAAFDSVYIHQAPSRNAPVASSAHLPAKQANNPILDAVIMRLGNSLLTLVFEPDQPLVLNCGVKQMVQFLIDCHELTSSASFLSTSSTARNQRVHPSTALRIIPKTTTVATITTGKGTSSTRAYLK
jgi:hypothetical protein